MGSIGFLQFVVVAAKYPNRSFDKGLLRCLELGGLNKGGRWPCLLLPHLQSKLGPE